MLLCCIALLCPSLSGQAASSTIDKLSAQIYLNGSRYVLPPLIEKRMQASVLTIADNLLSGRRIADVAKQRQEYERLIQDVFDRILIGYTVQSVEISVGAETQIMIRIMPWQDIIQSIEVSTTFEQIPEPLAALARQDIVGIEKVFEQILVGLPLDAAEWTRGVLKESLQDFLNVHLPEFRGEIEILPDEKTLVQVCLYPKGATIRDVNLSLRSDSLPNAALYSYRSVLQKKTELLQGLPAAFVSRHEAYFSQWLKERLEQDALLRALAVEAKVHLATGEKTTVLIQANTKRYLIYLEGYLDVSREEDSTSFRLHTGKYISPIDEIFLETNFFPHNVKWVFMPGFSRKITPQFMVGFKYNMDASENILWLRQQLDERWLLRVEHTPAKNFNEFAIRYKLHDFVGVEYVINDDEHWVRMIGNF